MVKIEQYQDEDGGIPYRAWFTKLRDAVAKAAIAKRIDRLALGNFGYCREVGNGVSELKIDLGPGYRVYVGQQGEKLVILLCGGDKSTQPKDIDLAKKYWADWKRRHK
jgi:putative addiction module killer protein